MRILALALALLLGACAEAQSEGERLRDMAIGKADAPIEMIEYASMTCGHCAQFHNLTLPKIKRDYIDKGKLRYVFREFPLDAWAAASSVLARCVGRDQPKRFFAFLDLLFQRQAKWALAENRMAALEQLARQAGMSKQNFAQCFENEALLKGIQANRRRGEADGVNATPSFLINGTLVEGNRPYAELKRFIDEALR